MLTFKIHSYAYYFASTFYTTCATLINADVSNVKIYIHSYQVINVDVINVDIHIHSYFDSNCEVLVLMHAHLYKNVYQCLWASLTFICFRYIDTHSYTLIFAFSSRISSLLAVLTF